MARRKKEPEGFHRNQIATAAEQLFMSHGITGTTMDDIAKSAGYSKATLYVYFKNKEEIVSLLTFKSMEMLLTCFKASINSSDNTKLQYQKLCNVLVDYQREFPFYFDIALSEINVDFEKEETFTLDKETYDVGELINKEIEKLLLAGMKNGSLRTDLLIPQTMFTFWASICGIVKMADSKKNYIQKSMEISPRDFLNYSFNLLYRSIEK